MDPTQWQLIESLFHRVVDLEPAARQEIYRNENISEAVSRDVENLIASDPKTRDRHLEVVQGEVHRAVRDAAERDDFSVNRVGEKIGDYELLRELGRGGQGVVYLARRVDGELRGQVAIKILQASLRAQDREQRFRQERHILSGLEHANIARFLDAGTTPDGWLFLVLEAVDGEPIPPPSFTDLGKGITNSAIDGAKAAVELCLSLIGPMVLWLGLMEIAKDAGLVEGIAWLLRPIMRWLFPEVPEGHPAHGAMLMNISANMLNLGNAATSFGLQAMKSAAPGCWPK